MLKRQLMTTLAVGGFTGGLQCERQGIAITYHPGFGQCRIGLLRSLVSGKHPRMRQGAYRRRLSPSIWLVKGA